MLQISYNFIVLKSGKEPNMPEYTREYARPLIGDKRNPVQYKTCGELSSNNSSVITASDTVPETFFLFLSNEVA